MTKNALTQADAGSANQEKTRVEKMKDSTQLEIVDDYKATIQSLDELQVAKRNARAKIEECETEIQSLTEQKAEIENELATAGDRILDGSMTNSEYNDITLKLLEVDRLISGQKALADVITKKLNDDFSGKQRDLVSYIRNTKRLADGAITQALADKIVTKCGPELLELAAISGVVDRPNVESSIANEIGMISPGSIYSLVLGRRLSVALFGGEILNPGYQSQQQAQALVDEVYKRFGMPSL